MPSILRIACLAPLLSAFAAQASLHLQLQVDTHYEAEPGGKPAAVPDQHQTQDVQLEASRTVTRTGQRVTVLDFLHRRLQGVDLAAHTRQNDSLYAVVAFRESETSNRFQMAKALTAAGVAAKAHLPSDVEIEHLFSIRADKPTTPLTVSTQDGEQRFSTDSHLLFSRSVAGTPATPDQVAQFARFVRYTFRGHPQVLEALAQADTLPTRFTVVQYDNAGVSTATVVVKTIDDPGIALPDFSAYAVPALGEKADAVDRALDRARRLAPADIDAMRHQRADETSAAFQGGNGLEALLGVLERPMMTGEYADPLSPERIALVKGDAAAQQVQAALAVHAKDDLRKAVDVFAPLAPKAGAKAYMLTLFEANDRAMLGDFPAAQRGLLKVLDANPAFGGAYKDLGDVLFQGFDATRAWRCWEAGHALAPHFPSFGSVAKFERHLAAAHPEFF